MRDLEKESEVDTTFHNPHSGVKLALVIRFGREGVAG